MALSGRLLNACNAVLPFWDALYILQIEEYRVSRLAKWLPRFFFRRNIQHRDHLVYTSRARLTLSLSFALFAAAAAAAFFVTPFWVARIGAIVAACLFGHLFVAAATWLLWPAQHAAGKRLMRRAARRLAAHVPPVRVVAIAGSYGKTTTKHITYQLVRHARPTQMIPGTINTPRGIANWILRELQPSTEVLIVEMDAYQPGEIAQSCGVTPPDIAVVTNVGDQHLERFRTVERLAIALVETFSCSKPSARLLCDQETFAKLGEPNVPGRTVRIVGGEMAYRSSAIDASAYSESVQSDLRLALAVADEIDVPERFVTDACASLELPDRRQRRASLYGYNAIDDSYNISFSTARAGLAAGRALATETGKKLLVVTAGIPELARNDREKNRLLGAMLREQADHTVVLGSMFAGEIARGMEGDRTRFTSADDLDSFLRTAHDAFSPSEWALLLQPELTDLYY